MGYKVSTAARFFIKEYETGPNLPRGEPALTAYLDSGGVPTIGWGSTQGVLLGQTITRAQAEALFEADIARIVNPLLDELYREHQSRGIEMTQQQVDAYAALVFNTGSLIGGAVHAPNTLQAVQDGNWDRYLVEMSEIRNDNGTIAHGLANRRADEAELFTQGDYTRSVENRDGELAPYAPMQFGGTPDNPIVPLAWRVEDASRLGTAANDVLTGGANNDALIGFAGADILQGMGGSDTASYYNSNAAVTVNLATGLAIGGHAQGDIFVSVENLIGSRYNDTLTGDALANTLNGLAGADRLDGGIGSDTASYGASNAAVTVNLAAGTAAGGHAQGDTLVSIENLVGSLFNDRLSGNAMNNTLDGGCGDDTLIGNGGTDRLVGGEGNDTLHGGTTGTVTAVGGEGFDTYIDGGAQYIFEDAIENFQMTENSTGAVNETLTAAVNDLISGFFGFAAAAPAALAFSPVSARAASAFSAQSVSSAVSAMTNAPRGSELLSNAIRDGVAEIHMDIHGTFTLDLGADGTPEFSVQEFNWSDLGFYLEAGREDIAVVGTSGNDNLRGTRDADLIVGAEGNDVIRGYRGNDELSGEQGNDRLYGHSGNDDLYGDRGEDYLNGGSGDDRLWGGADNDRLVGSRGDDQLSGGFGEDKLYGGSGNDLLIGGEGADRLNGGYGVDTADYSGSDEAVTVDLEGGSSGRWWWHRSHGTGEGGEAEGDRLYSVENLIGSDGDDTLLGNRSANTLTGGDGNDTLNGRWGNDTLEGGAGDDMLTGGYGRDTFIFNDGDGADTITDFDAGHDHWWGGHSGWGWGRYRNGDTLSFDLDGFDSADDVLAVASQSDDDVVFDFGDGDMLTLADTDLNRLDHNDFIFA